MMRAIIAVKKYWNRRYVTSDSKVGIMRTLTVFSKMCGILRDVFPIAIRVCSPEFLDLGSL